jgi:hypothetical protein
MLLAVNVAVWSVDRHQNWGTRVYAVRLPSP